MSPRNHGARFDGILKNEFASFRALKPQKPAISNTTSTPKIDSRSMPWRIFHGRLLNASCSAFHLQYQPNDELVRRIGAAQNLIEAASSDILFRCPPASLHMTILTLFPPRPEIVAGADAAWAESGRLWKEKIAEVCSTQSPLVIQFDTIEIANRAIFLRGKSHSELQRLRAAIANELAPLGLPLAVPDIAHVTLFRFLRTEPKVLLRIPVMLPGGADARVESIVLTNSIPGGARPCFVMRAMGLRNFKRIASGSRADAYEWLPHIYGALANECG